MNIINVGYNYKHHDNFFINRPYGSGDYVLLILKSDAYIFLNNKKQFIFPNSFIILKKGTPQIYGAVRGEFVNDWIHFEINDEEILRIKNLGISFNTIISMNNTIEISELIKSIFSERYSQNIYKEDSMNLYFELILLKLAEIIKTPNFKKENRYYNELSELRNEIYLKPNTDWNINVISKKMKLSYSYIQHLYKSFFGRSIISDITNSRIEYAKYLLSTTDFTVSYISEQCGYNSSEHFIRIFKKTTSITPTQYKKQIHIKKIELENSKMQSPFCL